MHSKDLKILFTGAQGTGKTTLVNILKEEFPELYNPPNFTRFMHSNLPNYPINKDTTFLTQVSATAFQAFNIMHNKNVIYDRSLIDTFAYAELSENISESQLKEIIDTFIPALENTIHFYTPIEFEIEADGVRSTDEDYRYKIDKSIKKYLDEYNIKYYTITGNVEERISKIKRILNEG